MRRRSADGHASGAALFWQALILFAVIGGGVWLVVTTLDNLAARGIASGFGFFDDAAGFGISMSLIPYSETASFARAFVVGLLNTLLVSALGIVLATALGLAVGLARLSSNWLLARVAGVYVEILRNIPLLLQIFFWYFAVLRTLPAPRGSWALGEVAFLNNRGLYIAWPDMSGGIALLVLLCNVIAVFLALRQGRPVAAWCAGIVAAIAAFLCIFGANWEAPKLTGFNFRGGVTLIPEFVALVVALSTYTAAFIAEIVRAGVQAVPKGQSEAADALGLRPGEKLRHIVLPQAMRVIVPPLTSQYLNLTKNSSLAAAIAYPDLVSVFAGTVLNITGQAIEVIAVTMAVYLVISLLIAAGMGRYNRLVALRGGAFA
jgi:general L-amino acid transport system permease protein